MDKLVVNGQLVTSLSSLLNDKKSVSQTVKTVKVYTDQLPPTEVGGLFLSSVVKRLKADSLPKDSVL